MAADTGFAEHVDLEVCADCDEGTGLVNLSVGPQHLNAHGTVHGGVLATVLDASMGAAVRTAGGDSPVTVSLTVTYLAPGHEGPLQARAQVRKRGKRLLIVQAEVLQGDDVLADALGTFAVAS